MRIALLTLSGILTFSFVACSSDDEGSSANPPGTDASVGDGGGNQDATVLPDGATVLPDGATVLPDGAVPDSNTPIDAGPCVAQAPTVPGLKIVDVTTSSFSAGLYAIQPPGSTDWYVVQQNGVIRIVRGGSVLPTPFLDLSGNGGPMGSGFGERGLLSIAFHPNYAQNGRFFLMGTPANGSDGTFSAENQDAVVEFKRSTGNPDVADPTKVRDIVVLPVSDTNHNSGTIKFGPDGYLYVATGDGGGGCEDNQPGKTQDINSLFGKVLRLDVDGTQPFAAPGNPFATGGDARIFHYGLRNPYRFNFDPLTNDLWIGDVGQNAYEEISLVPGNASGKNFGWPAFEGTAATCGGKTLGGPAAHTPPIQVIDRTSANPFQDYKSIVGGQVYRGTAIPALVGVYLFADYYGNAMGALRYCNGQKYGPTAVDLSTISTPNGPLDAITSFVTGNDGELYVTYAFGSRLGKFALK